MTGYGVDRLPTANDIAWLRLAYAEAPAAERPRRVALLALALLAYTDSLEDADPTLPGQLDELVAAVSYALEHSEVTASFGVLLPLAAGLARWRREMPLDRDNFELATLDVIIADLTTALGRPWTDPPARGLLAAPRWCLAAALIRRAMLTGRDADRDDAAAHFLEGLAAVPQNWPDDRTCRAARRMHEQAQRAFQIAGGGLHFGVPALMAAAPRFRRLLPEVHPGNTIRPLLRTAVGVEAVASVARRQRWSAEDDLLLAEMLAVKEQWGDAASAAERRIARTVALLLGGLRLQVLLPTLSGPAARAELDEVDALRAELESLSVPAPAGTSVEHTFVPDTSQILKLARLFVGALLAARASAAIADDQQPDPADLADSKRYLADMPAGTALGPDGAFGSLLDLLSAGVSDLDPAVVRRFEEVSRQHPEVSNLVVGRLAAARAAAYRATQTRSLVDVTAAVDLLRDVLRTVSSVHPARASVLALTATVMGVRAMMTSSTEDAAAAYEAALAAAELSPLLSREQSREALDALTMSLAAAVGQDLQNVAADRAQRALETALAGSEAADPAQRFRWTVALGTAMALRWPGADRPTRARTQLVLADAERRLGALPTDKLLIPSAMPLVLTLTMLGVGRGDPASYAAAGRVLAELDRRLAETPRLADELDSMLPVGLPGMAMLPPGTAGVRGAMMGMRSAFTALGSAPSMPVPTAAEVDLRVRTALRAAAAATSPTTRSAAATLLTQLLADGVGNLEQREEAHAALGFCLAAIAGIDPDSATQPVVEDGEQAVRLASAVRHLEQATAVRAEPLPTEARARRLATLAACYRAQASLVAAWDAAGAEPDTGADDDQPGPREQASDIAVAALRELFGATLLGSTAERAAVPAAAAYRIALPAVHWSIAHDDPESAVSMAEAGRGLVLGSVVLSGRVEEFLADQLDRADLAEGWRSGDAERRLAALSELTDSLSGFSLTTTPHPGHVSLAMTAAGIDAAVYVVPPVPGSDGALLVLGHGERPQLVRLTAFDMSVAERYLEAFAVALAVAETDPTQPFRDSPQGLAWAAALDEVGAWCHRAVIAPLLRHLARWNLRHIPHVALLPLGALGGVPFAAAWAPESGSPGARRYAIQDLVLTQAASGRLLLETARRPRLPIDSGVVLVTDPAGELPYARLVADPIAALYPGNVTCLPAGTDPDRDVTADQILSHAPGSDRTGAALLHLATHGQAGAQPLDSRLQASDRWLELREVLDQARSRAANAPGGLVICDACVTDSTRSQLDESITLATAFLTAGATATIGTRWPTDDDAAATFALRLHHELSAGALPAHALRLAQLAMLDPSEPAPPGAKGGLKRPRRPGYWAEPASWAGYVHHGV
jgi:CHAT domain-containing protein